MHMSVVSVETKRLPVSWSWSYIRVVLSCPVWVLGTNTGLLENEQVLLKAEPPLSPSCSVVYLNRNTEQKVHTT